MISSVPIVIVVMAYLNAVNADLVKGVLLGAMIAKKPHHGKMILMPIEIQSNGGNGEESNEQENQGENSYGNSNGQNGQMKYNGRNNNRQQGMGMKEPEMVMNMMVMPVPVMNQVHKPGQQMMNNNLKGNSMYGQMNGQKNDKPMYNQMNSDMKSQPMNGPPVYRERNQQNSQSYNQQQMNQYESSNGNENGNDEQSYNMMMNSLSDDDMPLISDRNLSNESNIFEKHIRLSNKEKNRHLYKNGQTRNKFAKHKRFNGQNHRLTDKMDNFYHI